MVERATFAAIAPCCGFSRTSTLIVRNEQSSFQPVYSSIFVVAPARTDLLSCTVLASASRPEIAPGTHAAQTTAAAFIQIFMSVPPLHVADRPTRSASA